MNQLKSEAKPDRRAELLQQLNLKLDHLTPGQRAQIEECLLSYVDVLALDASDLSTSTESIRGITHQSDSLHEECHLP